jgi:hypothetical protein
MSTMIFKKSTKHLTWGASHYSAITGPYGLGPLPNGEYEVKTRNAVTGDLLSSSYENSLTSNRWFIPITPLFGTTRHGFGIHPDGNVTGTKGCIGLTGSEAGSFWRRWMNIPLSARPTKVIVSS